MKNYIISKFHLFSYYSKIDWYSSLSSFTTITGRQWRVLPTLSQVVLSGPFGPVLQQEGVRPVPGRRRYYFGRFVLHSLWRLPRRHSARWHWPGGPQVLWCGGGQCAHHCCDATGKWDILHFGGSGVS